MFLFLVLLCCCLKCSLICVWFICIANLYLLFWIEVFVDLHSRSMVFFSAGLGRIVFPFFCDFPGSTLRTHHRFGADQQLRCFHPLSEQHKTRRTPRKECLLFYAFLSILEFCISPHTSDRGCRLEMVLNFPCLPCLASLPFFHPVPSLRGATPSSALSSLRIAPWQRLSTLVCETDCLLHSPTSQLTVVASQLWEPATRRPKASHRCC